MEKNDALQLVIVNELGLVPTHNGHENMQILIDRINELLEHDFQKLVSILYRMDVSEPKLRAMLKENAGRNSATIIAELMIERQLQKIKSRQQFRQRDNDINESEKW